MGIISPRLPSVEREGRGNGSGEGSYMSEKNGQSDENEGELESGMSKLCARGHWRPAEDTKLKELVAQYGPQNWNVIAEKLEGRSGKSCRLRWFNQLDPRINKKAFTEEEEERLLSAHRLYGNRWALIARLFPGRTDNAVKNHWHVIMARRQREQFNAYRRKKPLNTISCPSDKVSDKRLGLNCRNNASCAESTVSSKRDEPLSNQGFPFHGFIPIYSAPLQPQQPQQFEYLFGSDEKVVARGNEFYESIFYSGSVFHHVPPLVVVQGADHSIYSDSSSDASAMESRINRNGNAFMIKEADHERKKISLPFIDFLGVGAT